MRDVVDVARPEGLRVEPVRHQQAALAVEPQQLLGARDLRLGQDDHALAGGRPAAHPRRPRVGERPAPRIGLDRLEHQQLGPVQVADHRHARSDARGRLVDRRQVVQVQHVGRRGAHRLQRTAPGHHLALVLLARQRGEDAVRRSRPVLVGRVHRRIGAHRVVGLERARHVDRPHVEPGVELARVAGLAGTRERAGQDRHVPARAAERGRQVARDVRGAAAREEGERHHGSPRL